MLAASQTRVAGCRFLQLCSRRRCSASASIRSGGRTMRLRPLDVLEEIVAGRECIRPLSPRLLPTVSSRRQPSPGGAVLRIGEDVRRAVGEHEPRADRELQLRRFVPASSALVLVSRPYVRAHHAGDRIAVGDAEAGEAERLGLLDQLLRMRAAAQEGEIGGDGKLGIGGRGRIRGFDARLFRPEREKDGRCSCEHAVQEPASAATRRR